MPQCITAETDAQVEPSPCFCSEREAARHAINSLVKAGVLSQNARNRKSNIYTAEDVLDAFTLFERAAVTRDHNTARANPARPAPLNPNVKHRTGMCHRLPKQLPTHKRLASYDMASGDEKLQSHPSCEYLAVNKPLTAM